MTTKVEIANREGSHSVRVRTVAIPEPVDGEKPEEPTVVADQVLAPGDRVGFYVYRSQRIVIDELE